MVIRHFEKNEATPISKICGPVGLPAELMAGANSFKKSEDKPQPLDFNF
jgi:hypothetical protein